MIEGGFWKGRSQRRRVSLKCGIQFLASFIFIYQFLCFWYYGSNSLTLQAHSDPLSSSLSYAASDELTRSRRGHLFIHLGPPKTATSTLQTELGRMEDVLKSDGYAYIGKFLINGIEDRPHNQFKRDLVNMVCQQELLKTRQQFELIHKATNRTSSSSVSEHLYHTLAEVPCWKPVLQTLESMRKKGIDNIIVSDELLGYQWESFPSGRAPFDFVSLEATLGRFYHIHIVVGYRRYHEWLWSAKVHQCRWKAGKPALNLWPHERRGKSLKELLNISSRTNIPFIFTDEIMAMAQPFLRDDTAIDSQRIHVLDLHKNAERKNDPLPVRTQFLCHILPNAPRSCHYSREKDRSTDGREQTVNAGQLQTLVTANYDLVVSKAAELGVFPSPQWKRRKVTLDAIAYHQQIMGKNNNQTSMSDLLAALPKKCPSLVQLQDLLQETLHREEFVLSKHGGADVRTAETKRAFKSMMDEGQWCMVDVTNALQQPIWRTFFKQLLPSRT